MDNCAIHVRDLAWLKEADCLVAEVTTPSLGVGFEIGKATEWGLWILCLFRPSSGRVLSALIAGNDQLTVREYQNPGQAKKIFEDFFGPPNLNESFRGGTCPAKPDKSGV
jgi:hypothetical protein